MAPSNVAGATPRHPDLALAERCRRNEPGAFEELYRLHAPRLFGLTYRLVGPNEAEDLMQEIFLSAHRKMALYKGEAALGTWLFRMGTNQCLDYLRSKRARLTLLTDAIDRASPESFLAVDRALDQLERHDPRLVELIQLRVFAGLELGEIAPLFGVTIRQLQRDWQRAQIWLSQALLPGSP